jgi:exoribonuclease R
MQVAIFDQQYCQQLLPKYGNVRDPKNDETLLNTNTIPHYYTINERVDLTNLECYSIDPEGCTDADDAFSIYHINQKIYLAIHIADPTEYINLESELWNDIIDRVITHYPSNRSPIHMLPNKILQRSSLMDNESGNIKNAISIISEISPSTYLPIHTVNIYFTKIRVDKKNNRSYSSACQLFTDPEKKKIFNTGIKISESLLNHRKTAGKKINSDPVSNIKYNGNIPYLEKDSQLIFKMKQMIAEFAIFANSFVGQYLKFHLQGKGIFRTCDTQGWINQVDENCSGDEIMRQIVDNGIAASYLSTIKPHDLVGMPEYCHFTSPIRRLTDCVCHYLLKYIHLKNLGKKLDIPFTSGVLDMIANKCDSMGKRERKLSFEDNKFRIMELLQFLCYKSSCNVTFRYVSYTGLFLNFIISKINGHRVSVSYVLRIRDYPYQDYWEQNPYKTMKIKKVFPLSKFDEGKLPEFDKFVKNPEI